MPKIEHPENLRSAFLKIGWAPVIAYGGSVLLYIIGFLIAKQSYTNVNTLLSSAKVVTAGCPTLILAGYLLSYLGFRQAQASFGITRAGDAFATLKILFLIFTVLSALTLIVTFLVIGNTVSYTELATSPDKLIPSVGLLMMVIYIITVVYTIIALLIIREKMRIIAETTNIDSLEGAYVGARVIIYFLCIFFVSLVLNGLFWDKTGAWKYIIPALGFINIFLVLYAIVKWVKGWLGAALEVVRHEVEAEDYTDQKNNVSADE